MTEEHSEGLATFNISEDFIQSPQHKAAGTTSVDFDGLLSSPLLLHEDLTEGCGGQLWPAGMVLAKYLLKMPVGNFQNKTILELGAGGGLVGLAVAKRLQSLYKLDAKIDTLPHSPSIHVTDQAQLLPLLNHNIELNALSSFAKALVLDWGVKASPEASVPPDILLAADCVYFEPAFPLLLQTLKDLISRHTICYFCFKKRRRADLRFIKDMKKVFVVEDLLNDTSSSGVTVGQVARDSIFLYKVVCRFDT